MPVGAAAAGRQEGAAGGGAGDDGWGVAACPAAAAGSLEGLRSVMETPPRPPYLSPALSFHHPPSLRHTF